MNTELLKAHALVAQHKMSAADFDALILGMVAGNKPVNYYEYIQSLTWKRKAEAAKLAVGYRCQVCNQGKDDGVRLDAHHRTYQNLGHEKPEDITVLCDHCHELFSRQP